MFSTQIGVLLSGVFCFLINWFYLDIYGIEFASIVLSFGSLITIFIVIGLERKNLHKVNFKVLTKFVLFSIISAYLANLIFIDKNLLPLIVYKFLIQSIILLTLDYIFGKHFFNIVFKKI